MPKPITDANLVADTAYEILTQSYRAWSVDRFLCHPTEAIRLCRAVRKALHRPRLRDYEILWTLINSRKRGRTGAGAKPDRC
jgi:hypothetical protein